MTRRVQLYCIRTLIYFSIDFPTKPSLRSNGKGKGKPAKDEGRGGWVARRRKQGNACKDDIFFFRSTPKLICIHKEASAFVKWPVKKDGDNPVNQSKLEVITRSRHKARENVHAPSTIGFGFTSDWLKKWRENFEPITE